MINILSALLFSTLIMVSFKLFERYRIDTIQAITVNYIVAVLFGIISYQGNSETTTIISLPWLFHGILIGIFFIVVFFIFAISSQKVGIAITAVSSKMSVVIPIMTGILILKNDYLNLPKVIGILMALIAFYLTFKRKEKVNLKKGYFLLPLLLFLGNGTNDSMMSYATITFDINQQKQTTLLLIIIFSTALTIGLIITVYRWIFMKKPLFLRNMIAGIILGLFNYLSTYYFLRALDLFPPTLFFPVFNAGIVTLSALTGFFVFREKLRPVNWAGIAAAVAAIVIIALAAH